MNLKCKFFFNSPTCFPICWTFLGLGTCLLVLEIWRVLCEWALWPGSTGYELIRKQSRGTKAEFTQFQDLSPHPTSSLSFVISESLSS